MGYKYIVYNYLLTFNVNLIKCCWIMLMAMSNTEKWLSHTKSGHFFKKMDVTHWVRHFWKMVVTRLLWTFLKNLRLFDWNIMTGLLQSGVKYENYSITENNINFEDISLSVCVNMVKQSQNYFFFFSVFFVYYILIQIYLKIIPCQVC